MHSTSLAFLSRILEPTENIAVRRTITLANNRAQDSLRSVWGFSHHKFQGICLRKKQNTSDRPLLTLPQ